MSIVAFTDGLSVALLLPLLSRVGIAGSAKSAATIAINKMLGLVTPVGSGVGAILVVILILSVCQMGLNVFQGLVGRQANPSLCPGLAAAPCSRLCCAADWLFLTGSKGGELSSAIIVETGRLGGSFYYFTAAGQHGGGLHHLPADRAAGDLAHHLVAGGADRGDGAVHRPLLSHQPFRGP